MNGCLSKLNNTRSTSFSHPFVISAKTVTKHSYITFDAPIPRINLLLKPSFVPSNNTVPNGNHPPIQFVSSYSVSNTGQTPQLTHVNSPNTSTT